MVKEADTAAAVAGVEAARGPRPKCSQCDQVGHCSRMCDNGGGKGYVKLFGVHLFPNNSRAPVGDDGNNYNKKKKSFGGVDNVPVTLTGSSSSSRGHPLGSYLSDDCPSRPSPEAKAAPGSKKRKAWSEEEERRGSAGGSKTQGRGNCRGISDQSVPPQTPTQFYTQALNSYQQKLPIRSRSRGSDEGRKRQKRKFDGSQQSPASPKDRTNEGTSQQRVLASASSNSPSHVAAQDGDAPVQQAASRSLPPGSICSADPSSATPYTVGVPMVGHPTIHQLPCCPTENLPALMPGTCPGSFAMCLNAHFHPSNIPSPSNAAPLARLDLPTQSLLRDPTELQLGVSQSASRRGADQHVSKV